MDRPSSDIAFTPSVKAAQVRLGSRDTYRRMENKGGFRTALTDDLMSFIAERDSLYLASVSSEGQPYVQHRGGPKGFLRKVDDATLGITDFSGNRQYVTLGNLADNPKAFIFLMDYANRRRIKIWGEARVVEDDADLMAGLAMPGYREGRVERAILFRVTAWDINCPQHITPRHDVDAFAEANQQILQQLADLETENADLKRRLAAAGLASEDSQEITAND